VSTPRKLNNNPQSVTSALNEAQSIIAEANKRAEETHNAAARAYEEAKDLGYAAGYRQGLSDVADHAVRFLRDGASLGSRLTDEAARLAISICTAVIGEHVKVDPELVKKIARRALQQSIVGDVMIIIANPDDQEILQRAAPEFRSLTNGAGVKIEVDPSVSRGGCIVRTEFGEVDASIPALLESMAAHLGLQKK
jgi:type III secretion system HrpE/YscL family protein